jgi:dihydrofolate synthase / folylpolyglutamate synthase
MSYAAAIDALNALAPELYTQPGRPRHKFSLAEIGILLAALGNPHQRFKSILIAGTNGKGSTASTLASILVASGLRTGLYTSPHLERPNERLRINGEEISNQEFADRYFAVHAAAERLIGSGELSQHPSFFEILTAMAFLQFAHAAIDIAVLEVGMGGRLDATNIVSPLLSVITDISLDHTEWLGPTVSAIAREKAGILRRNGTLITLPQHPEANQSIGEIATDLNVRAISATPFMPPANAAPAVTYSVDVLGATIQVDSPLHGAHQHRNLALAIAAAEELARGHNFPVTPQSIAAGIRATKWPGRLEEIRIGSVLWVLDVAHNPAGAWALRAGLRFIFEAVPSHPRTLVFACLRDKPLSELAQILFPLFDRVIFAPIHSPRAATMEALLAAAESTGTPAQAANSVAAALELARARAGGLVAVSGSVYLVGEARTTLLRQSSCAPSISLLGETKEHREMDGPESGSTHP